MPAAESKKATELLEKVATDPQTEADIKATLHNAREASDKANRMLGVLDTAKVQADVTRSVKGSDWRSNLELPLLPKRIHSFISAVMILVMPTNSIFP